MKIQLIINKFVQSVLLLSALLLAASAANASPEQENRVKPLPAIKGIKVLIIVSSDRHGFWLPEVVEPYQLLANAGYLIDIASPKGGQGRASGSSRLTEQHALWFEQSPLKRQLQHSMPLADVKPQAYAAVYFAGGAGPMFDLPDNKLVQQITRDIYEAGGIVSADCHGPAALINVMLSDGKRLVSGRQITAKANSEEGRWARNNYPFLLEDKIKALGGKYLAAAKNQPHVVVDGRLITGQNPASAIPVAKSLLRQLAKQSN
ncbi:type 1 glutamine amidotransferase domain-containing protein [Thalassomonas viridans]|uniref:Type 1 glutamine amidotransferase domain-containing protein n=1 Tax=Thalassomonas viridans TaxID=137584 RepID=A0AAF0C9U0_9GAMM|nr:type 1 glutamine amidotransferase domain-containing protein [Thalassomonas viridans]WDE06148.1 type 1 glutamine amidotransferase domain-containing protein [Thalassomonas viridans]